MKHDAQIDYESAKSHVTPEWVQVSVSQHHLEKYVNAKHSQGQIGRNNLIEM